jgi:hypothetical protein
MVIKVTSGSRQVFWFSSLYMKDLFYFMKKKNQILLWNRGKVQSIPGNLTFFAYQMLGCPDIKKIVENDVKTPISLSD